MTGRARRPRWPRRAEADGGRLLDAGAPAAAGRPRSRPLAILAPLGWFWQASLLPGTYSVMDMGYADYGGGPSTMTASRPDGPQRRDPGRRPDRPADVRVTLTARKERFRLASGQQVDGYTVNGTSPGPVIRAVEGQLVEVRLVNASVPDGVTLHWHGVDVPNAEDGVAGVTQDAVPVGGSYTYRFVADQVGTYWYHSHQVSHAQVQGGLLGALVVTPKPPTPDRGASDPTTSSRCCTSTTGTPTVNGALGRRAGRRPAGATRAGARRSTPTTARRPVWRPARRSGSGRRRLRPARPDARDQPRGAAHRRRPGRPRGHRTGAGRARRSERARARVAARRRHRRSRPGWSTC